MQLKTALRLPALARQVPDVVKTLVCALRTCRSAPGTRRRQPAPGRRTRSRHRPRGLGRWPPPGAAAGWRPSLVVAEDEAAAAPPGEVAPGQVDQGGDPVAAAGQGGQVQR